MAQMKCEGQACSRCQFPVAREYRKAAALKTRTSKFYYDFNSPDAIRKWPKGTKSLTKEQVIEIRQAKRFLYESYIKSAAWVAFRRLIIADRGNRCEECGASAVEIHLHHLHYESLGHEQPEDVRLLCVDCHGKEHKREVTRHSSVPENRMRI